MNLFFLLFLSPLVCALLLFSFFHPTLLLYASAAGIILLAARYRKARS